MLSSLGTRLPSQFFSHSGFRFHLILNCNDHGMICYYSENSEIFFSRKIFEATISFIKNAKSFLDLIQAQSSSCNFCLICNVSTGTCPFCIMNSRSWHTRVLNRFLGLLPFEYFISGCCKVARGRLSETPR